MDRTYTVYPYAQAANAWDSRMPIGWDTEHFEDDEDKDIYTATERRQDDFEYYSQERS